MIFNKIWFLVFEKCKATFYFKECEQINILSVQFISVGPNLILRFLKFLRSWFGQRFEYFGQSWPGPNFEILSGPSPIIGLNLSPSLKIFGDPCPVRSQISITFSFLVRNRSVPVRGSMSSAQRNFNLYLPCNIRIQSFQYLHDHRIGHWNIPSSRSSPN